MTRITTHLSLALASLCFVSGASAQQWGDLKMKFVFDGTPPAAKPISVDKDPQFCGKFGLVDEELIVNKSNGGIANVIVYMYTSTGPKPAIHPDYSESADAKVILDNAKCRFEPRVAILRTTQTLVLKNSDMVGHNTNYATFSNPPQNILIPEGSQTEQKLAKPERRPAQVACNIHPWMKAWLVVQETPYAGASDKNGELVLKNVPVGKWTFQLWHEAGGYVSDVKLNGEPTAWKRGRPELTIKPGMNDLGEIKFKP